MKQFVADNGILGFLELLSGMLGRAVIHIGVKDVDHGDLTLNEGVIRINVFVGFSNGGANAVVGEVGERGIGKIANGNNGGVIFLGNSCDLQNTLGSSGRRYSEQNIVVLHLNRLHFCKDNILFAGTGRLQSEELGIGILSGYRRSSKTDEVDLFSFFNQRDDFFYGVLLQY